MLRCSDKYRTLGNGDVFVKDNTFKSCTGTYSRSLHNNAFTYKSIFFNRNVTEQHAVFYGTAHNTTVSYDTVGYSTALTVIRRCFISYLGVYGSIGQEYTVAHVFIKKCHIVIIIALNVSVAQNDSVKIIYADRELILIKSSLKILSLKMYISSGVRIINILNETFT